MAQTAQSNSKPPMSHNFGVGASHARSLSQPSIFSNCCLPPLSPIPPIEPSMAKDMSMEEVDVNSQGPNVVSSFTRENTFRGSDGLPPRKGHRRSNSDVPLGFSAMIQSSPQLMPISGQKVIGERKARGEVTDELLFSYMNLENIEALNSPGTEDRDKDSMVSGTKVSGCDSSNNEAESVLKGNTASIQPTSLREGTKRSADANIAPAARHFRSLSMDSGIGSFKYGDESPNLPTSLVIRSGQLSPSNSGNESSSKHNFDFGNAEFSEAELKKIMADERLAEIAVSDPKRAKRILANRLSAARSKERKLRYISELEHKVQKLQTEATTLSTQVTILQKDFTEISSLNSELKFRIQAMEQQAQLRDALHETLTAEVQRLKLAAGELREEGRLPNSMTQQMSVKHNMFQMQRQQPSQMPQLSVGKASASSATPASA
ncbi:bZIP transcription factor 29-like [Lycium barbarum]|uniref:bZIP transcription factor 29-like n=1 Tax=Lycium barbarum TaxID=112863 RepID=UPI00293E7059|nr:bZIP transcription factor 29-like [Lycium barbarum]XP_060199792.1 bZIP transcription factor 29-like [Lycium barbarum]